MESPDDNSKKKEYHDLSESIGKAERELLQRLIKLNNDRKKDNSEAEQDKNSAKKKVFDSLPEYKKKAKRIVLLTLLKNHILPESERKQIDYHKLEEEITARLFIESASEKPETK